jgi:hypothetical protein
MDVKLSQISATELNKWIAIIVLIFLYRVDVTLGKKKEYKLPRVNFTNVLRASFAPISSRQKCTNLKPKVQKSCLYNFRTKKLLSWWN